MTCRDFERWLDDGRPSAGEVAMRAHAGSCAACAAALAAMTALEAELARPLAAAPADFTDRVLDRIERPAYVPLLAPTTPWWLGVLTEPTAVLTLLLIAVMTAGWDVLWSLAATFAVRGAEVVNRAWIEAAETVGGTPWAAVLQHPEVVLGLELSGVCLSILAMPVLYRLSMRMAERAARRM